MFSKREGGGNPFLLLIIEEGSRGGWGGHIKQGGQGGTQEVGEAVGEANEKGRSPAGETNSLGFVGGGSCVCSETSGLTLFLRVVLLLFFVCVPDYVQSFLSFAFCFS